MCMCHLLLQGQRLKKLQARKIREEKEEVRIYSCVVQSQKISMKGHWSGGVGSTTIRNCSVWTFLAAVTRNNFFTTLYYAKHKFCHLGAGRI